MMKKIKELYDEILKTGNKLEGSKIHFIIGLVGFISSISLIVILLYLSHYFAKPFIVLLSISAMVIFWASKESLVKYKKPFSNIFVLMSITLFISIIVTGVIGISYLYESEYPDKILYGDSNNITGTCYGYNHKDVHVMSDYMRCVMNMSGLQYDEIKQVTAIREVNYVVDNRKDESIQVEYHDKTNKLLSVWVPLKYSGMNLVILKIEYVGNNYLEIASPLALQFNVLTIEEYNKRQYEKYGLYALLLSVAATVSFSGVKSFMEIWESAKKEHKN